MPASPARTCHDVAAASVQRAKQPIILLCSKVDHLGNMQLISNVYYAPGLGEAIGRVRGVPCMEQTLIATEQTCHFGVAGQWRPTSIQLQQTTVVF
jgi:hypothetical protein